jgi:hypothetical protein
MPEAKPEPPKPDRAPREPHLSPNQSILSGPNRDPHPVKQTLRPSDQDRQPLDLVGCIFTPVPSLREDTSPARVSSG